MKHTFMLRGVLGHSLREPLLSELATSLVQNNVFWTRDRAEWMHVPLDVWPTVEALEERNLVESYSFNNERYIALAEPSLRGGLCRLWGLSNPIPALRVRPDIALTDMTSYELITVLKNDGWSWCLVSVRHLGKSVFGTPSWMLGIP